jgi:hypothetical protein
MQITPQSQRVLEALHELAGDTDEARASWAEIAARVGVGRTYVAGALRELKAVGWIEQRKGFGQSAVYQITRTSVPEVRTNTHYSALTRINAPDESDELIHDADGAPDPKILAMLGEFLIEEPTRTQLAVLLKPHIDKEKEIRGICERTLKEHVWRRPRGVMVRRLRAFARGEQDPLPVFKDQFVRQSEPRKKSGQSKSIRRPQVEDPTEAEREQAREAAKVRIAERAQRRMAQIQEAS